MIDETKKDETIRLLNAGKKIETKTFGELTVRELTLEQTVRSIAELTELINVIDFKSNADSSAVFQAILKNESTMRALRVLASAVCKKSESEFKDIPLSDWLKIFVAFIEVNDLEELKELFIMSRLGELLTNKGGTR